VTAAMHSKEQREREPNEIQSLISKIRPALQKVPPAEEIKNRLAAAVESNVRWSVSQLKLVPDLAEAVRKERTVIMGCVYDLETGRVRTL